ncbi:MAG: hypothetical protein RDU41_09180 [Clostridia bacterium]|nr:hypothetical protein [Clostridia bacterium]
MSEKPLGERVSAVESDVKNLTGWQTSQNGAIHRVEAKVDKLQFWIMTVVAGAVLNLLGLILTTVMKG